MDLSRKKDGSVKSSLLGGEDLVTTFRGDTRCSRYETWRCCMAHNGTRTTPAAASALRPSAESSRKNRTTSCAPQPPTDVSNADERLQFWALYLTRFAQGVGFITLITLLPTHINTLNPQGVTVFGLTISAGFIIGTYTTGFRLAQTATVVPLAWAGDRLDKRRVFLTVLGTEAIIYRRFKASATGLDPVPTVADQPPGCLSRPTGPRYRNVCFERVRMSMYEPDKDGMLPDCP